MGFFTSVRRDIDITVARLKASARQDSDEVAAYLPKTSTEEMPQTGVALSAPTQARLSEVAYLVAEGEYARAATMIQAAYERAARIAPLVCEHNILLQPFENMISHHGRGLSQVRETYERLLAWYETEPRNVFAGCLTANALIQLAFAYRGIDPARNVGDAALEHYDTCISHAKGVMTKTEALHGDHWYWRATHFELALSDYQGEKDHRVRFDRAIRRQPFSAGLFETCAHHLLPRWHGSFEAYAAFAKEAHERTSEAGSDLYYTLFDYIMGMENNSVHVMADYGILRAHAERCAAEGGDANLTKAASLYFWTADFERALEALSKVETLYSANWHHKESPRFLVSMALVSRERAERKQAGNAEAA